MEILIVILLFAIAQSTPKGEEFLREILSFAFILGGAFLLLCIVIVIVA